MEDEGLEREVQREERKRWSDILRDAAQIQPVTYHLLHFSRPKKVSQFLCAGPFPEALNEHSS